MADAVMGDRSCSVVLAAIAAGYGDELCKVDNSMIAMPCTLDGQPDDRSFLSMSIFSSFCWTRDIQTTILSALNLVTMNSVLCKIRCDNALHVFFALNDSKSTLSFRKEELLSRVRISGRRPRMNELRSFYATVSSQLSGSPAVNRLESFMKYERFVNQKIDWLSRWHRSEARWTRVLQGILQRLERFGGQATLIVAFLFGSGSCDKCSQDGTADSGRCHAST